MVPASVQQGSTSLRCLRDELYCDSFHAVRLDQRVGQISILYNNGDGCCLFEISLEEMVYFCGIFVIYECCYKPSHRILQPPSRTAFAQMGCDDSQSFCPISENTTSQGGKYFRIVIKEDNTSYEITT